MRVFDMRSDSILRLPRDHRQGDVGDAGFGDVHRRRRPDNLDTAYQFQYGTTSAYGQPTPTLPIGQASGVVALSATIRHLTPGTTYHFRLVAAQGSYRTTTFSAGNDLHVRALSAAGGHGGTTGTKRTARASLGSRTLGVHSGGAAIPFACKGAGSGSGRSRIAITARAAVRQALPDVSCCTGTFAANAGRSRTVYASLARSMPRSASERVPAAG
jgi:hypothetical protein